MRSSRDLLRSAFSTSVGGPARPSLPIRALRQQVAALQMDRALNLNEHQAQALLPLLEGVRSEAAALEARRAAAEPALASALAQAIEDLTATGAVSDATFESIRAAERGFPGTLGRRLESFWRAARRVLTADQLLALKPQGPGLALSAASLEMLSYRSPPSAALSGSDAQRTLLSDPFLFLLRWRAGWEPRAAARA